MKIPSLLPVLKVCAFAATLLPHAHAISIDAFTSAQRVSVSGPPIGPRSEFGSLLALEALGGERDILVERTSVNNSTIAIDVAGSAGGVVSYNSGVRTTGRGLIVWDGIDGSASIDTAGLGGIDLTEGGMRSAFRIDQTSDLGGFLTLTVYQDATRISRAILGVLGDPSLTFVTMDVLFSSFTPIGVDGGADFSNVGALSLLLDGSVAGADIGVGSLATIAVPEGSASLAMGLFGLALFGFFQKSARF